MFDRSKPKQSEPSASSPDSKMAHAQGSYMNSEQFSAYLRDLRNNRVNRPGGARPQPQPPSPESRKDSFHQSADGRPSLGVTGRPSFGSATGSSMGTAPALSEPSSAASLHSQSPPKTAFTRDFSRPSIAPSVASRYSTISGQGRDYYPDNAAKPLSSGEVVPSSTYMERGQRWMEKEEAVSLRQALEDKDASDRASSPEASPEDDRLYEAALAEASELVWRHQNGVKSPEPGTPYRYTQHLRRDSYAHAKAASTGIYGSEIAPSGLARDRGSRSASESSASSDDAVSSRRRSFAASRTKSTKTPSPPGHGRRSSPTKSEKSFSASTGASRSPTLAHRRRSSLKRNSSSGTLSANDKISEEPEVAALEAGSSSPEKDTKSEPLRMFPRSPFSRRPFSSTVSSAGPLADSPKLHRFDIHRNPPSQSRNPEYTTNSRSPSPVREDVPKKHGMELRGDDIRQATSMKLKDRSPKLPTPIAVSDRIGRPIVSFDKNWKAPDEATNEKPDTAKGSPLRAFQVRQDHRRLPETPPVPAIAVTETRQPPTSSRPHGPAPPSIQVEAPRGRSLPSTPSVPSRTDNPPVPSIVLPGDDDAGNDGPPSVPIIVTPDDPTSSSASKPTSRPLPTPQKNASRPRHSVPRGHWSPAAANQPGNRATALCHDCGFPIEGRFIALAGTSERFHPQCFSCYICGTSLEALEISPEPDSYRAARLERIRRRAAGEVLDETPGETMAEDGDERLRFYCHLDWHELFAPRCKHCKTPILGEHVVALGEHWHYGHFFCAECGDPFERGMTHIEKDGYAWCVNCQTKRTERRAPKCKMCKKAVIGQYIRALGGEWHDECFRCATCQGGFDDGQIFPRESPNGQMVVLCTKCRERELKS